MTVPPNKDEQQKEQCSFVVENQFGDAQSALEQEQLELLNPTSLMIEREGELGYYVPPIPFERLIRLLKTNPQHGTLPTFRANVMAKYMLPNPIVSREALINVVTDDGVTGNGFFQVIRNRGRGIVRLTHLPAIRIRKTVNEHQYCYLVTDQPTDIQDRIIVLNPHEVLHAKQYDPNQNIYGIPHWIGAMQSILLGEDVRIFPRLFFKNGGTTGDILATSGLFSTEQDVVEKAIYETKGGNRFKRILLQFPRGEIDKNIKSIPYSSNAEKIDYSKLANLCATDVLEAWRIRPELAGMVPEGAQGTGDLEKIRWLYYINEIQPLQQKYARLINEHLPQKYWLKFKDFDVMPSNDSSV